MSKAKVEAKDKKETESKCSLQRLAFGLVAAVILILIGVCAYVYIDNLPFRLSDEYYGKSESITLKTDEYEQLVAEKKSFIVLVDKPGCVTTAEMRQMMADFPDDMQFKYYNFMWSQVKESSLHEYISFAPSVAIIKNGKVKAYLRSDVDEDGKYFYDAAALQEWVRKYVAFD